MADSSQALCEAIAGAFPDRPFSLRFWDGNVVESTRPGPALTFNSPRALGHVLRAPGELGLGRAYVTGEIDVDDLDGVIALLGRWHAPPLLARHEGADRHRSPARRRASPPRSLRRPSSTEPLAAHPRA